MINYPVTYHPGFFTDLLPARKDIEEAWTKVKRVAIAAIPILGLHRPFRAPLTVTMSAIRSTLHFNEFASQIQKRDLAYGALHFCHATIAAATIGLFFFNPVFSYLASSTQDLALQMQELILSLTSKSDGPDYLFSLEKLAFMALDLLFIASFCYGAIQITVACMLLQIAIDLYLCAKHVKEGEYIEGAFAAIAGGAHLYQAIPQCKLLRWTWKHGGAEFTAELKQNQKGFVYLDIPDEYVYELFEILKEAGAELPPYFDKNQVGAHISVILSKETAGMQSPPIAEVGQKFTFRIVQTDVLKPDGFAGVKSVSFLSIVCPELEQLRTQYGLSSRIGNTHDFHLTFTVTK